jgi:CRISPR-associated protein Cmr1
LDVEQTARVKEESTVSQEINATFKIVTPMFLGDAGTNQLADTIRPPSVKGALRFWWRALQWPRFAADSPQDIDHALRRMHEAEGAIFGQAADDHDRRKGQSSFLLRIDHNLSGGANLPRPGHGQQYLLGQGLFRGGYRRNAIDSGGFQVHLRFRHGMPNEKAKELGSAFAAWGLLGGLGSRARRGLGSVAIQTINGVDIDIPFSIDSLKKQFVTSKPLSSVGLPPFTAISSLSRIEIANTSEQNAWGALGEVGLKLLRYCSFGVHNAATGQHEVGGKKAEQNLRDDHDWVLNAVNGVRPTQIPVRGVFGFPHNYFFKSKFDELVASGMNRGKAASRAKAELAPNQEGRTRRSSPLFIHIHQFPKGEIAAIQSLLPATLIPSGGRIRIETARLKAPCNLPFTADYRHIHAYLDRFHGDRLL